MRRLMVLVTLLFASGVSACGSSNPDREYKWNDLMLITSYTAKTACSCMFVANRDEAYCRTWAKEDPPVAGWTVDTSKKTVTSSALMFWGARAHFVNDHLGCVLE